jgi:hypothetical protein
MELYTMGQEVVYTDAMRRAFHSVMPPKGFGVNIIDN